MEKNMHKRLIIVFTGNGKGKTTASLGCAFRAAGHRMKVLMVQFIKSDWKYGELETAKKLRPEIEIYPMGKGYVFETDNPARKKEHKTAAEAALKFAEKKINTGRYDFLILDEINNIVSLGVLSEIRLLSFLKKLPRDLNVILTGRNAGKKIIQYADLVTEMKEIKHPYKKGILARKGIEY